MLTVPASRTYSASLHQPGSLERDSAEFWRLGFLPVRGAFSRDEMAIVREAILDNPDMRSHSARTKPRAGQALRLSFHTLFVWNDTGGSDLFSKVTRSHRIIDRLEAIFRDRVYVYHNKVALKYPGVVGFDFHQDFAYWYHMGVVYPDMASVFIAVDPANLTNGCLKLVAGSHRLGRLDHVSRGAGYSDSGVDPERLAQIRARMPTVAVELDPGDMVIFHCNTLHGSDDNRSADSRLALLGCYNTQHNSPYKSTYGHPAYQAHEKIRDPVVAADRGNLPRFTPSAQD